MVIFCLFLIKISLKCPNFNYFGLFGHIYIHYEYFDYSKLSKNKFKSGSTYNFILTSTLTKFILHKFFIKSVSAKFQNFHTIHSLGRPLK